MTYVMIEDLAWDELPGGSLVSTLELFDEGNSCENPDDAESPIVGPASVEYRVLDGEVTATVSTTRWVQQ